MPAMKLPLKDDGEPGTFGVDDDGTSRLLWKMLAYLLIILVLGAVGILVVKRLVPRLGPSAGRDVSVLETLHLGPRKSVYLLRVGDRRLLIAGARDSVSMLADVTNGFADSSQASPESPSDSRDASGLVDV